MTAGTDGTSRVTDARQPVAEPRLLWVDVAKGLSILWIAYFHLFQEAVHGGRAVNPIPPRYAVRLAAFCVPAVDEAWLAGAACVARALVGSFTLLGFHAVGVFLLLSGFSLARALGDAPRPVRGWAGWYRRRLVRLFPLYWAAHAVILVAAALVRLDEPLDARLLVSLTGLRLWPIETAWFYFNPSFWYFTLLLQLYAVFPLLWWLVRRSGPLAFAAGILTVTAAVRWQLFAGWAISTHWAEGGFFAGRMAEFGCGVALGTWHRRDRLATEARLFRPSSVTLGLVLWWLGIVSYRSTAGYCFTNSLIGAGLFVVVANVAEWLANAGRVATPLARIGAYSYGIFLLHQPFVMKAGEQMTGWPTPSFVFGATAVVGALVAASIPIERAVNRLTDRVIAARAARRPAPV